MPGGSTVRAEVVPVFDAVTRTRFVPLTVTDVVPETVDAVTVALDVPAGLAELFAYRAGQFVTVRVVVGGVPEVRSYSMSSVPGVDRHLRITVKRVAGGVVSTWLSDRLFPGDRLDVAPPAGGFVVDDVHRDVVAFAAGSGITPVFSIVRSVLGGGTGRVSLLYANRDARSVIFGGALDRLAAHHADRFELVHHLDTERGVVTAGQVAELARARDRARDAEAYVCGPPGFIGLVESALVGAGVEATRVHVERFTPAVSDVPAEAAGAGPACELTIRLGARTATVAHRPGTTLLQAARSADLRAPSSCETGSCATCMARITDGEARMRNNEVLTADEVADGWVLTCQAEPTTDSLTVVYE